MDFKNLKKVEDIIEFDGPLVSLFKGPTGDKHLCCFFGTTKTTNKWMVFPVSEKQVEDMKNGKVTVDDVRPSEVWIVELDNDIEVVSQTREVINVSDNNSFIQQ